MDRAWARWSAWQLVEELGGCGGRSEGAAVGGGARQVWWTDGGHGGRWRSLVAITVIDMVEGEVGHDSLRWKEEVGGVEAHRRPTTAACESSGVSGQRRA
jgi:hypothetical protein